MQEIQIKPGYKMTELGIIPEDWKLKTFNESFDFLTSASFSRDELDNISETKCIHYGDIHTKWNYFLDISKEKVPGIQLEKAKKYPFLKDGDLIMVDASEDYAGISKSVEIKNIGNKKIISGLHTFLLRGKNDIFENGFKGYIVLSKLVKNSLDRVATGLKVYGVSKGNLKNVFIPVPKSDEQKLIAKTLSDTDELIKLLDELIEKKEKIKEGTMQELLTGKRRLPGFNGEWENKKLGNLSEIYQPQTISQENFTDNGFLVYGANGVVGKYHSYNHNEWQNIITCRGSTCGTVNKTIPKSWITGNAMVINVDTNKNIEKIYLYYLLLFQDFSNCITGSGQPQIVRTPLFNYNISISTDKNEQKAIAEILSDMDNEIENLKTKRDKYKKIKDGMMQELLTGKIRLV